MNEVIMGWEEAKVQKDMQQTTYDSPCSARSSARSKSASNMTSLRATYSCNNNRQMLKKENKWISK